MQHVQGRLWLCITTRKERLRRPLPLWVKQPCWQALKGSTASGPVATGGTTSDDNRGLLGAGMGGGRMLVVKSPSCRKNVLMFLQLFPQGVSPSKLTFAAEKALGCLQPAPQMQLSQAGSQH